MNADSATYATLALSLFLAPVQVAAESPPTTPERMIITVPAEANRQVAFTNKGAAYFLAQTHHDDHPEHAYFRGLNIAGRRIVNDFSLRSNGRPLESISGAQVSPLRLTRQYGNGVTATYGMVDERNVLVIDVDADSRVDLALDGEQLKTVKLPHYAATQPDGRVDHVWVLAERKGKRTRFLVSVADSLDGAQRQARDVAKNLGALRQARSDRLLKLTQSDHLLLTSDPRTNAALSWITLTMDSLITRQRGDGIYAGLPWFPEYWGRDTFISLPGAALVTGQFETARNILRSFAKFQDRDEKSEFFGRLPNIVKPESLDYHTTDGTPRFVIALRNYVDYSGDSALARELYPVVKASIEGSLRNWTDAKGYLVHADNETWMDARREPDHASYSPRANRANDIQALWLGQLMAGAVFARLSGDEPNARKWTEAAEALRQQFKKDFVDAGTGAIADHLKPDDRKDWTLRPNALFALGMVDDGIARNVLKNAWTSLVFPWGVATLDPKDAFFHPYHLAKDRYHKDEAYHNGTVWPWLNGIAMQRMIEWHQQDTAWKLFTFSNELALTRGGVGGLPETMDAYPHPGESAPRLTGTFLQAWSNAEHLRTWYQGFLGIQPQLSERRIRLAPRIPGALGHLDVASRVGEGAMTMRYRSTAGGRHFGYAFRNVSARIVFDLPPYPLQEIEVSGGDQLTLDESAGHLQMAVRSADGTLIREARLEGDAGRAVAVAADSAFFAGIPFATVNEAWRDRVPVSPLPPLSEKPTSP